MFFSIVLIFFYLECQNRWWNDRYVYSIYRIWVEFPFSFYCRLRYSWVFFKEWYLWVWLIFLDGMIFDRRRWFFFDWLIFYLFILIIEEMMVVMDEYSNIHWIIIEIMVFWVIMNFFRLIMLIINLRLWFVNLDQNLFFSLLE